MLRKITAPLPQLATTSRPAWTFGVAEPCCTKNPLGGAPPVDAADATDGVDGVSGSKARRGSRRRRLWELGAHAHCPLIGICLPTAVLRRLAHGTPGVAQADNDFDLHILAVGLCARRSQLAEALQAELDSRHRAALHDSSSVKSGAALQAWWTVQLDSHDIPGALWAVLSHPRCNDALEDSVLGQVHMLQHQVGMATRVEVARFEALINENAVLSRALGAAQNSQQRQQQQIQAQARLLEKLQSELVRLRGRQLAFDSERMALNADLAALRAGIPQLAAREALAQRVAQQDTRIEQLQRELARQQLNTGRAAPGAAVETLTAAAPPSPAAEAPALSNQAVLCVGGRTGSVPIYRRLIENCGGRFLHHDGGEGEHVRRLDATLAAADLVICQTGCLSHEAYWRVKDHCKRTGKRCVFVDTPSAAHLQRALSSVSVD